MTNLKFSPKWMTACWCLLAGVVACLLVACGSGSGGSSDPLTKAEFLQQANQICAEANKQRGERLVKAGEEGNGPGGVAELNSLISAALESVQELSDDLAALEPLAAQKKTVGEVVHGLDRGVATLKAKPAQALGDEAFKAVDVTAARHGLPACRL